MVHHDHRLRVIDEVVESVDDAREAGTEVILVPAYKLRTKFVDVVLDDVLGSNVRDNVSRAYLEV